MIIYSYIMFHFNNPPDTSKGGKLPFNWLFVALLVLLGYVGMAMFFLHPELFSSWIHGANIKLNVPIFEPYKAALVIEKRLTS